MSEVRPFNGFPAQGVTFLRQLAKNNDRDWFNEHKQTYLEQVLAPAQSFVAALGPRLTEISPTLTFDLATNGSGSILRIYRDVRFSKDKRPYNTSVRFRFWEGPGKKESPGYFIGFDPSGGKVYSGLHAFSKEILLAYRRAVDDRKHGTGLERAIGQVQAAGGYEVGGDQYKKVPREFDPDHPRADLLRYKGLYALSPRIEPQLLESAALVETCFQHCQAMAPLHLWLKEAI